MKKLITAFAILALTLSTGAFAQVKRTVAKLPTAACTAGNIENNLFIVTDGDDASDCTSGGGTAAALCICDGGVFVPVSSVIAGDLSDYVPVTKAGQQSITATGAGNDITFTAPDTIVFAIAPFKSLIASSSSDTFFLESTGATDSEVSLVASNAADASDSAMVAVYSEDDAAAVLLQAGNSARLAVDQASGMISVIAGGFRGYADTAPPYACDAAHEGVEYFDTDIKKKCICNGTAYVLANDDTTTTGCS